MMLYPCRHNDNTPLETRNTTMKRRGLPASRDVHALFPIKNNRESGAFHTAIAGSASLKWESLRILVVLRDCVIARLCHEFSLGRALDPIELD